jgi:hypothetical protein
LRNTELLGALHILLVEADFLHWFIAPIWRHAILIGLSNHVFDFLLLVFKIKQLLL